jgi:hypothetical protein
MMPRRGWFDTPATQRADAMKRLSTRILPQSFGFGRRARNRRTGLSREIMHLQLGK